MNTTTVYVKLEIEGKHEDAFHVVDALLDAGFFQDAVNDHDHDDCGPLHVKVAICGGLFHVEQWVEEAK